MKQIFYFLILFSMFSLILSQAHPAVAEESVKQGPGTLVSNETEKKLIAEIKISDKSSVNHYNLGEYYFSIASDYDMKYFWGKPRNLDENKDKAISYAMKAVESFTSSRDLDPNNATTYAKIAEAYGIRMRNGGLGAKLKYMGDFKSNLEKSLKLDPQNFEGLITKAYKTLYSPNLLINGNKAALTQFEKLLEKYPDNSDVTKGLAITHQRIGNIDRAFEFINRSLRVNSSDLESLGVKEEIEKELNKQKSKKKS